MANVFGSPVTNLTVKQYHREIKNPTAKDRAAMAFEMMEDSDKRKNAETYVQNPWKRYDGSHCTLITIYNATGGTLLYYKDYDFYGHIGEVPYPNEIQNGQWAAFLHVHKTAAFYGGTATIVYTGVNNDGTECAWLNAWDNPYSGQNHVYCEIRPPSHYDPSGVWDAVHSLFKSNHFSDTTSGCYASSSIGQSNPYTYVGTMTLEGIMVKEEVDKPSN